MIDARFSSPSARPLLLDGGTGSELRRRGLRLDAHAWSGLAPLTHYDLLRSIHFDYVAAGADAITTNTFGAARFVLEAAGEGDRTPEIVTRAVAAAREARDAAGRDVAIVGSISCLPPRFDVTAYPGEATERAAYRELAERLAAEGVDALALEMMQDERHAPLACEAAAATGLPLWLGVSCRRRADGTLVAFDFADVEIGTVLDPLLPFAPAIVMVMHTPLDAIEPALALVASRWRGARGAYAEIGDGGPRPTHAPDECAPDEYAARALRWVAAGASAVGGCCGTSPAHVRVLAHALRGW